MNLDLQSGLKYILPSKIMDELFDKYEKLYCQEEPKTLSLDDWINTTKALRGQKVIPTKCRDCNTSLLIRCSGCPVCPECGITSECNLDTGYTKKSQAYKRMTHFRDWISKTQARHSPEIPETVLVLCKVSSDKSYKGIRTVLRNNKHTKYYEDIYYIMSIIDPEAEMFRLTATEETVLCCLFMKVCHIWNDIKPLKRKSIISYPFIISELLDIIKRPELKRFFYLPRYNKVLEYKTHFKRILNNPSFDLGTSKD